MSLWRSCSGSRAPSQISQRPGKRIQRPALTWPEAHVCNGRYMKVGVASLDFEFPPGRRLLDREMKVLTAAAVHRDKKQDFFADVSQSEGLALRGSSFGILVV